MADNYLEKRYFQVFGNGSHVDPETGYEVNSAKARKFPVKPVRKAEGGETVKEKK